MLNSGLKKCRHGALIVELCNQLRSTKTDAQSVMNWTVVGQQKVDNTSELRQSTVVVYHRIVKLCVQQSFLARVS